VLDHLYDDHAIPPERIAEAIQSRGGLEAVASSAAKVNPRRSKSADGIKIREKSSSSSKKNPFKSSKGDQAKKGDDIDGTEDWDAPGEDAAPPDEEDSEIVVRISPALRAKLLAIKSPQRVKMIAARIDTDDWLEVVLEAEDVRRIKD
jgi:hypothetical protein